MDREELLQWCEKPDSRSGTSIFLSDGKIDFSDVSDITKVPEILGGRVKTLHPSVHGGTSLTSAW